MLQTVEGAFLLMNPTVPGVSQVAGVVLIGHAIDTAQAAMRSVDSGKEVQTITHDTAVALAKKAGLETSADTIGMVVEFGLPISASLASPLVSGAKKLLTVGDATLNSGEKNAFKLSEALPDKAKNVPLTELNINAAEFRGLGIKLGNAAEEGRYSLPLVSRTTISREEAQALLRAQLESVDPLVRARAQQTLKEVGICFVGETVLLMDGGDESVKEFEQSTDWSGLGYGIAVGMVVLIGLASWRLRKRNRKRQYQRRRLRLTKLKAFLDMPEGGKSLGGE
jgi:hypothetical protein